jgi:hypothetical protein
MIKAHLNAKNFDLRSPSPPLLLMEERVRGEEEEMRQIYFRFYLLDYHDQAPTHVALV